ncbi:MAG: chemotaxis protein CheR [Rickettsiales bacterium]|nr:chemotaxis protein CheR [Rickettsiales bacterium]
MASREFVLSPHDFRFLAQLVKEQTGIVLAEHKRDMVYSRLVRRLRALGLPDFNTYCALLQSENSQEEMGNLVNAITTNLTSFFREAHHFEHLANQSLPESFATNAATKRLRIWSAGCSSGAEPYSLAMVLAESMKQKQGWDSKILATDIDTSMLQRGREGIYRMQDWEAIPKDLRSKYAKKIQQNGQEVAQMSPQIARYISFKPLNLLQPQWPMKGPFDIIFCRNVVIYFDKPTQSVLFDRYAKLLRPRGWLYVGHSENLFKVTDKFELIGKTIYRKKEGA